MYKCQLALIKHLEAGFEKPAIYTIEEYSGQINTKAQQITCQLPAALVMFSDAKPMAQEDYHQFDILVITESRSLEKETNRNNNLQLVSDIAAYLETNYLFAPHLETLSGRYEINKENAEARIIFINGRFCITGLLITIYDHT